MITDKPLKDGVAANEKPRVPKRPRVKAGKPNQKLEKHLRGRRCIVVQEVMPCVGQ